ncbi:MAG: hypothetical protein HKP10_02500 [Kiritimatiellales bacterium]|nr:hypothetical protein [Pontiella sp.]NNJ70141.1 hypothetical protein [Kiritimatiellales bacterium]
MKKQIPFLIGAFAVLFTATALDASAAKKNEPKDPEEILEATGGKHFVEKMKVDDVGSVKVKDRKTDEESYYHVYSSYVNDKYRLIIFDNTPRYLGYYETNHEPIDYEEGAVLLGDSESPFKIRFRSIKEPPAQVSIDGVSSPFVKNEKAAEAAKQEAAAAAAAEEADKPIKPEYRDWQITMRGQTSTHNAIFVQKLGSKVKIKESKRGKTATVPISSLSKADQDYLKKLGVL